MNTNRGTNRSETTLPHENLFPTETNEVLSDEALDHVVGGINPQPLPPHGPEPRD